MLTRNIYSQLLGTSILDNVKTLFTLVGDVSPIFGGHLVFREKLRTHSDAENTGSEPLLKILFLRRYTTSDHNLAPRHGCFETLDHVGPVNITGEELR